MHHLMKKEGLITMMGPSFLSGKKILQPFKLNC